MTYSYLDLSSSRIGCQSLDWARHKAEDCKKPPKPASRPTSASSTKSTASRPSPPDKQVDDLIAKFRGMDNNVKATVKQNEGIIVEVQNCANFLSAVNDMLGKEGRTFLDFEIREDVASAKPANMFDMQISSNISKAILGVPIGRKGVAVTIDDVIAMLRTACKDAEGDSYIKY